MPAPSVIITFNKSALKIGEVAQATFSFSEAPVGFTAEDVTVTNGTLSGLTSTDDPLVYTGDLTPGAGLSGVGAGLFVAAGSYTNLSGDPGLAGASPAIPVDTLAPTVSISSSTATLRSGESATITLTFSEAPTGFSLGDLSATGGTLGSLVGTADPLVYTADFTPQAGVSGVLGSVSLAPGAYTDAAGNSGGGGSSSAIAINTLGPSVAVTAANGTLKAGENTEVTFTFSSVPTSFAANDIVVSGGTVSGLTNMGAGVYTATFTPASGVDGGVASVSVASGSYTDNFGNLGGGASSGPVSFDTRAPTVAIAFTDPALGIGQSGGVSFTFSEAVSGFGLGALTVDNGALSGLSTSDSIVYTATLTPSAGVTDMSNVITVNLTGVSDQAGNAGAGSTDSPNYVVDATRPTATIVMADTALKAGETSEVTITFSEAVTGFTADDLSIPNGAISVLSSSDGGITWIGVFTPNVGFRDSSNLIILNNSGLTDWAGNAGIGTTNSANFTIDTVRPTASIVVADTALTVGETTSVTITFSEAVSGFTTEDLQVDNGAVSNLTSGDGGVTWTATLTPASNVEDSVNFIVLDRTGVVAGASGNAGLGTVDSNYYAVDTARPTATIAVANALLQAGQTSLVTITFSEAVSGLTIPDLSVANGGLSNLSTADGGVTWTATLTPSVGVVDSTNLIVLDTSGVTDSAGNVGGGIAISNNYQVGYVPPPPVSEDDVISLPPGGGQVAAGPGSDSVAGAGGADLIQGNIGNDTLSGGGGDDIVRGGQDNDFVHGNTGADQLFGDLGNDSVFGGQGDDFVQGGAGGDYVIGDLGRDTVLGGQGADTVVGGAGDDYLSGDLGDDVLLGGAGADLFNFRAGSGRDVVMDFSRAEGDRIAISSADAADFAALSSKLVADGGDTIINLDGQTIVLAGVAKSALSAADFVFG
ncbi:Ig-like domain-containing protein [Phenylobacterium sp. 58.2.17]|uniref:Ig-like domain-containing protein n=1 Tax=Phenylobacterium sp. 58.2.17 TaxID=2969306 RepID=UPI002264EF76|nr:Ig-like domain-containing protein [Phenylobacterium sp. 58.2.17]MCX7588385.1 Ig-like domain-containing protein [Phenylobacterium sp. 58.2.17]